VDGEIRQHLFGELGAVPRHDESVADLVRAIDELELLV
jgi:hypothetical protein